MSNSEKSIYHEKANVSGELSRHSSGTGNADFSGVNAAGSKAEYSSKILGVRIDFGHTYDSAIQVIASQIHKMKKTTKEYSDSSGYSSVVCTTNPEFVLKCLHDAKFKTLINNSLLSLPDGVGIVLAHEYLSRVAKLPKDVYRPFRAFLSGVKVGIDLYLKPNIFQVTLPGVDLVYALCSYCEANSLSIFLLGGMHKNFFGDASSDISVANLAKKELERQYPDLIVVGATSEFSAAQKDDERTLNYVSACLQECKLESVDVMLVAYTFGDQEKWIARNSMSGLFRTGVGVGGTLDYMSNVKKRPSKFFLKLHLEWFYRLITQPHRIKRVVSAFLIFPCKVYLKSIKL